MKQDSRLNPLGFGNLTLIEPSVEDESNHGSVHSDDSQKLPPKMELRNSPVNSDSNSDDNEPIESEENKGTDDMKQSAQSDNDNNEDPKSDTEEKQPDIKPKPKPKKRGMQLRNRPVNSETESDGNSEDKGSTENNNKKATEEGDEDEVPEIDLVLKCKTCTKTFTKYLNLKKHKLECSKVPKKDVCPKCGKKFCQRSLLEQHYDFYHTNKPKRFVCKPCNKAFPLKKTLQEHNRRLHNDGDFKFVCDVCGRGFFVRGAVHGSQAQSQRNQTLQVWYMR